MLLKQADVGLGFRALRTPGTATGVDLNCAALDESDLTVTGEARSPYFTSGLNSVWSTAGIYASVRDATASWRRGTSAAGFTCLTNLLRREASSAGMRHVSFRKIAFPAVAPHMVAYRWQTLVSGVRVYTDIVFLMRGRAQAVEVYFAAIDPLERDEELRLTRLVSNRMAKAMRGA